MSHRSLLQARLVSRVRPDGPAILEAGPGRRTGTHLSAFGRGPEKAPVERTYRGHEISLKIPWRFP
jgi:hypothetical protein